MPSSAEAIVVIVYVTTDAEGVAPVILGSFGVERTQTLRFSFYDVGSWSFGSTDDLYWDPCFAYRIPSLHMLFSN